MKGYYNGYSYVGWIPNKNGGGCWEYFVNDTEYKEAYKEASLNFLEVGDD